METTPWSEGKPPKHEEQERPSLAEMEAAARGMFTGADPPDPRKRKRARRVTDAET